MASMKIVVTLALISYHTAEGSWMRKPEVIKKKDSGWIKTSKPITLPTNNLSCLDDDGDVYKNGEVLSLSTCAVIFCQRGQIKHIAFVDENFGCPHVEMVKSDGKCTPEAGFEIENDVVLSYTDCHVYTCKYGEVRQYKHMYCEPDKQLIDTKKMSEKFGLINKTN